MEQNEKKIESHSNALDETNAKTNNAIVMDYSNTPIDIKGLDVSNFFEDPNGKIEHLIGGV